MRSDSQIPYKANKILNLVLLAFILILMRVWYLGFVLGDHHRQQARKPQRKTIIEKVERATIRDRFNLPMAQNKIDYTASVRYADLRNIPAYKWEKQPNGPKTKVSVRGAYISSLAKTLGDELHMNPEEIEDVIYAKATLFPHTPFVIKEGLTEKEYYRIRMLQKDWLGMEAQRTSKRVYPQGKTGCDVIGYMGAINRQEYVRIAEEIKELRDYITKREEGELVFLPSGYEDPIEVRSRLKTLLEKSYTINDRIGKTGIEASMDETLRGIHGKSSYEVNPKGNILRKLPSSRKGIAGQRVFLSVSAELQQFAEDLLAHHEAARDVKDERGNRLPGTPWIKGGAVVVLEPKTGEVLTLASYPRFDPNDFIPSQTPLAKEKKQQAISHWLENESYVGDLWDGKQSLQRELYSIEHNYRTEETQPLTWSYFLSTILPPKSAPLNALGELDSMQHIFLLHKHFEELLKQIDFKDPVALIQVLYPEAPHIRCKRPLSEEGLNLVRNKLAHCSEEAAESLRYVYNALRSVPHNDDKLLVLDISRLLMVTDAWTPSLLETMGFMNPADFLTLSQSLKTTQDLLKDQMQRLHRDLDFKTWREKHFKNFLKQKRREEKEQKKPTIPYTDYLEKTERALFKKFWATCKHLFLEALVSGTEREVSQTHPQLAPYFAALAQTKEASLSTGIRKLKETLSTFPSALRTFRSFEELDRPLYGKYHLLRNTKGVQLEKHLAAAFYPLSGFGYGRSQAFRQSTPQGSVFKLAVGYEALKERYAYLQDHQIDPDNLNPLVLIDRLQKDAPPGSPKQTLGYTLDGHPIRRRYKGGMLPRSHPNIGKIDLQGAIEQSSNLYFAILAAEHVEDPSRLEQTTYDLGFGTKTGIDLQGEIKGNVPSDLGDNKTGLYSFAIGQHSLVVTPLQTAVMLSTIVNGGIVLKPQIVSLTAGKKTAPDPFSSLSQTSHPFQESLLLAGIDFPLFTESLSAAYSPFIHKTLPEIKRTLFLPREISNPLIEGMNRVVSGSRGTAHPNVIRYLRDNPKVTKTYLNLRGQLIGKTGTAEILYKQWLDSESKAEIHNHIWFGGVLFPENPDPKETFNADPELIIVVYLRFSEAGGKEAAPIAAQIGKKWRDLQKNHQGKSYLERIFSLSKKISQDIEKTTRETSIQRNGIE